MSSPQDQYQQHQPAFLALPPELRNHIYDYIAYTSRNAVTLIHHSTFTAASPLSHVCRQLRWEYRPLHHAVSLANATSITIYNANFNTSELVLSLQRMPAPTLRIKRTLIFRIAITKSVSKPGVQTFVSQLATSVFWPPDLTMDSVQYRLIFDPAITDFNSHRLAFAGLAKRYRFHHCDAEQRVWEKIYWAFAETAEKVDGVSVREYASGVWRTREGGLRFI